MCLPESTEAEDINPVAHADAKEGGQMEKCNYPCLKGRHTDTHLTYRGSAWPQMAYVWNNTGDSPWPSPGACVWERRNGPYSLLPWGPAEPLATQHITLASRFLRSTTLWEFTFHVGSKLTSRWEDPPLMWMWHIFHEIMNIRKVFTLLRRRTNSLRQNMKFYLHLKPHTQ